MNYPSAIQRPGPVDKVWPDVNQRLGVICHSMEGYEAGAWSQLDGPAEASWHFSVMQDGRVFQHYPLEASPWHAGTHPQNARLIGVEHEGVKGQPLTPAQVIASVGLVNWIGVQCGWTPSRDAVRKTLWEHREVPGSSTTCPNGRIDWTRYMPTNDPNREDNFDTGLTRINAEAAIESVAKIHKQAEGDAIYLVNAINRVFGVNYHL